MAIFALDRYADILTASFMAVSATLSGIGNPGTGQMPPRPDNPPPFVLHRPPDVCQEIIGGADRPHPAPQELAGEPLRIVTADGQTYEITVEHARTPKEHAIGLMYRDDLPDGQGMLFTGLDPLEGGQLGVWMKDTYVPLDIVFLDEQGRIVAIHEGAQPCDLEKIMSGNPAYAILELKAGAVDEMGLQVGGHVDHPAFGAETAPDIIPPVPKKTSAPAAGMR